MKNKILKAVFPMVTSILFAFTSVFTNITLSAKHIKTNAADNNATIIFEFLTKNMELNEAAACGVLANIENESGFIADRKEDGWSWEQGAGYGICQWTNTPRTNPVGRRTNLINWCNANGYDYRTLTGQLFFLKHELETNVKPGVYTYLKNVENSSDGAYNAGWKWCYSFEVPQGYNKGVSEQRGNLAKEKYWPMYKPDIYPPQVNYPADLGNDFWAMLLQPTSSKPIVQSENKTVLLGKTQNSDSKAQYWRFVKNDFGGYRIRSMYNNLFLTAASDTEGINITCDAWKSDGSQDWFLYQKGDQYQLRPSISNDKLFDINCSSTEEGTAILLWYDTNTQNQLNYIDIVMGINSYWGTDFIKQINQFSSGKPIVPNKSGKIVLGLSQTEDPSSSWWRFMLEENGSYSIQNFSNRKFLGCESNETGSSLVMQDYNENTAGVWDIHSMGDFSFLYNNKNHLVLDIDCGMEKDGTKVQLWNAETAEPQHIVFNTMQPVDLGTKFTAKMLQSSSGKQITTTDTDHVVIGSGNNGEGIWEFTKNSDNSYCIKSTWNNRYLDTEKNAEFNQAWLLTSEKNGKDSQSWFVYDMGSQTILVPKVSKHNLAMDIDSGMETDGTKVQLWTAIKSDTQNITIVKTQNSSITTTVTTTSKPTTTTTTKNTTTTAKPTTTITTVTTQPLKLNETSATIRIGEKHEIKANQNNLIFKSSNEDVAMVSKSGVISGVANGTATITVANADKDTVTFKIVVKNLKTLSGDTNCDGEVNMADAVLIMQSLANPSKYGVNGTDINHITEQGILNGDMDGNGLTNSDALTIQKIILKIS